MLKKEFVEKQKKNLLEEKAHLEERIKKLEEYPDYGDDEEDNTQEVVDFENNTSLMGQLSILLKKVDKALSAIEDGTYGQCKKCEKAIEEGRLEIMPYAELCVSCKKSDG